MFDYVFVARRVGIARTGLVQRGTAVPINAVDSRAFSDKYLHGSNIAVMAGIMERGITVLSSQICNYP